MFRVPDVGSESKRHTAGVFDFQVRKVKFGLTPCQESYASAVTRESERKPLPDSPARTCYQNTSALYVSQGR